MCHWEGGNIQHFSSQPQMEQQRENQHYQGGLAGKGAGSSPREDGAMRDDLLAQI